MINVFQVAHFDNNEQSIIRTIVDGHNYVFKNTMSINLELSLDHLLELTGPCPITLICEECKHTRPHVGTCMLTLWMNRVPGKLKNK